MAAGGTDSSFTLPTGRSAGCKGFVGEFGVTSPGNSSMQLEKVFGSNSNRSKPLMLANLDDFLIDELNKVSAGVTPQIRDGVIGPEEIKMNGSVLFDVDKLGITGQGSFSTVKANVCVYKGRWMYEVLLGSKGLMQLGWCSLNCKFTQTEGVGDTPYSFAFDGNRVKKWNVKTEKYGESWLTGDVITCAIDCDEGTVSFYRNGQCLGLAFDNIPLGPEVAYFPAVSLSQGEAVRLNFGATPFMYPVEGYLPMEIPPEIQLRQCNLLLGFLKNLLPEIIRENEADSEKSTFNILLLTNIFEHLVPRLKIPYVMQGSFIPFLRDIVDTDLRERDAKLSKVIDIMWGLMEDHEIKICLEHLLLGLLTLYRFSNTECYYKPQKSYLYICYSLLKHEPSRKYAVKYILFDKIKFPLFLYIKPPDDSVLQHIVPTVWWESNHVSDQQQDQANKQAYFKSCAVLQSNVREMEDIQVNILKELLCEDRHNEASRRVFPSCQFLHKFRLFVKENINDGSDGSPVQAQHCSLPVILALFHRLVRTVREIFAELSIREDDGYVPVEFFVNESFDYFKLQRVGGLKSHLNKTHEQSIKESNILEEKSLHSKISNQKYSNPRVDKSLIELLDGIIMLYYFGAHKQLQKMNNVLSETVDCYVSALDDVIDKLNRCPPNSIDVHLELERSRQVFEEKVIEQSRHLSWLIAVINSAERMADIIWVFDTALRTVELASELNPFFDFMPEFYISVCVDGYTALKNFFKLSQTQFTDMPNYKNLVLRYGMFLAKHFADPRIINIDPKDLIVQSLACFVCYESSLSVLESLPVDIRDGMVKSLLAPYENRAWAQTNWILVRLWKGNGFAFRFIHLPHLAPAKHQTQEIGAASLQKPCPSEVFQKTIAKVLTADSKRATQFINSVLNQLNWAFSEFITMIQELQQLSIRSDRSIVELRTLKICATCFDISVGLIRVLEMIATVAPQLFLEFTNPSAELLLSRVYQSMCLILNRVASKANVFDTILSLSLPGMETVDHFPIITAILGVLLALVIKPTDKQSRERSVAMLTKEPGFQFDQISNLISLDSLTASSYTDRKSFSIRNFKEINSEEVRSVELLVDHMVEGRGRLDSKSDGGDDDDTCTICYAKQNSVIFKPCLHTSCRSCITHQMLQNNRCFFCMSEIESVTDLIGQDIDLC